MRKKNIIITILALSLSLTLTSCFKEEIADSKGRMLKKSMSEIQIEEISGFYVLNKDNTFTPVMNAASEYQSANNAEEKPDRFVWFSVKDIDLENLIPVVTKKTPLVGIFQGNSDIPEKTTIEKYNYHGYTIGVRIKIEEDMESLKLLLEGSCKGSNAQEILKKLELNGDEFKIVRINNNKDLPTKNIDPYTNTFLGLDKNKKYQIGIYEGSKYRSLIFIADTLIMKGAGITELKLPYRETEKGYFVVNLPEGLKEGYYYIAGAGLFRYEL